jgi:peptidoglycan hydrolase CwlO-like protein
MIGKTLRAIAAPMALSLLASGCFVSTDRYMEKTQEADTLRDALASANKEKNVLAVRNESLQKQVADLKETGDSLAAKVKAQEAELSRLNTELAAAKKSYEGTRITREELISELLDKEKSTGKRIQELSARAQACDAEGDRLRKEIDRNAKTIASREAEIGEMRAKLEKSPKEEEVRLERDTLLGKVERLTEDRKSEEKRRDARFEEIAAGLKSAAPTIQAAQAGPVLRMILPDKGLLKGTGPETTESGKALFDAVAKTVVDFPSTALLLSGADEKAVKGMSAALEAWAKLPAGRIIAGTRGKGEVGLELLVVVP